MICEVCRERRKDTNCDRLQDQEKKKRAKQCMPTKEKRWITEICAFACLYSCPFSGHTYIEVIIATVVTFEISLYLVFIHPPPLVVFFL
jgi:hypothetical protein